MSVPVRRRRRITAASSTPEKLATFLRHLDESGSVSFAAQRTGVGRNTVPQHCLGAAQGRSGVRARLGEGCGDGARGAARRRDRPGPRGHRARVVAARPAGGHDPRVRQPPADAPAARAPAGGLRPARTLANNSEQLEHEQNRRRGGVLFDVPERPGLSAFSRTLFLKNCDSTRFVFEKVDYAAFLGARHDIERHSSAIRACARRTPALCRRFWPSR